MESFHDVVAVLQLFRDELYFLKQNQEVLPLNNMDMYVHQILLVNPVKYRIQRHRHQLDVRNQVSDLGSLIIGVLALPTSLRRGSLPNAEKALPKNDKSKSAGGKIQFDFKSFLDDAKTSCGVKDWIEWATQYRNMYVHRGRRTSHHQISAHESPLYDYQGRYIPRATTSERLLKHPDRTDIEAFIKSKDIVLDEEVNTTLQGIFKSCRDLNKIVCEELVSIWIRRRNFPALLDQPIIQWEDNIRGCDFSGYDRNAKPLNNDTGVMNPVMKHRMLAASVFDQLRDFWENSKRKK